VVELRADIALLSRPDGDVARQRSNDSLAANASSSATETTPPIDTGAAVQKLPAVNAVDGQPAPPALAPRSEEAASDAGSISRCEPPAITELAQRLATKAGIEAHLRFDPSAPLGFWTIVEPDAAHDLQPPALRVWWLLAYLARNHQNGDDAGPALAKAWDTDAIHAVLIHQDATDLLDWLLNPIDPLAGATLAFLDQLRSSRTSQGSHPFADRRPDSMEDV